MQAGIFSGYSTADTVISVSVPLQAPWLMPSADIDVATCCAAHRDGKLNPSRRSHVLRQLSAEGHKRVESFIFEKLATRQIVRCLGPARSSTDWLFQRDESDKPSVWFRICSDANPWRKSCDKHVIDFLDAQGCQSVAVSFDGESGTFIARVWSRPQWGPSRPLDEVLGKLLGRSEPRKSPRNYSYIKRSAQQAALRYIRQTFSDDDLHALSLSRTFVNCFMWPWFGKQPMDIDAAVVTKEGLRFLEFKRKYPTREVQFGIDEKPHGSLIDWLNKAGSPLLHVILVDPIWSKSVSPLHLLRNDSRTAQHAAWLGIVMDGHVFDKGSYSTQGADSGMFGGTRAQRKIREDVTCLLGTGLAPDGLEDFLATPSACQQDDLREYLGNLRDRASRSR